MRHMGFDRGQGDEELVRDLLIAQAMGDFHQHLTFAICEQFQLGIGICGACGANAVRRIGTRSSDRSSSVGDAASIAIETCVRNAATQRPMLRIAVLHHFLDQTLGGRRRDDRIALEHGANRIEQRLRFGVFEQKTRSAGIDGGHHIFIQIECGQDDHTGRLRAIRAGGQRSNTAGGFDAIHARHAHVHQHHIGVQGLRHRHGLGAIGRLSDHFHILLRADYHGEAGPHQLLVVRNDHANASALVHALHCIRFLFECRSMDTLIVP